MSTVSITNDNFTEVSEAGLGFFYFTASWCGPCRVFGPVYEKASEKHSDIIFGKIDADAEQELGAMFGIRSIPTVGIFKDGSLVYLQPGALSPAALEELIEDVRALEVKPQEDSQA